MNSLEENKKNGPSIRRVALITAAIIVTMIVVFLGVLSADRMIAEWKNKNDIEMTIDA